MSVADGRIDVLSRAQVRARFESYFEGAEYAVWDDLEPPRIARSPDGRRATVHRRVRSERTEPAFGGGRRSSTFESAWTATYAWDGERWRMTSVTSTFLPAPSDADHVLAGARRRVGLDATETRALRAAIEAEGPGGSFGLTLLSSPEGSARIDFHGGVSMAIRAGGGWRRAEEGTSALSTSEITFLRGHEAHLLTLLPGPRLSELRSAGETTFEDTEAIRLVGEDAHGAPVELYYARSDTLPLGYLVRDHTGDGTEPVIFRLDDWRPADGPLLARRATIRQGPETFRYRYVSLDWVEPDPDAFRTP